MLYEVITVRFLRSREGGVGTRQALQQQAAGTPAEARFGRLGGEHQHRVDLLGLAEIGDRGVGEGSALDLVV